MKCTITDIPGYADSSKIKNARLEIKISQMFDKGGPIKGEKKHTLYRGEGKSRMAKDPAMQFAEEGSAVIQWWSTDEAYAKFFGTVSKKQETFAEKDMFNISPIGDKIEQGWVDLLKAVKHTRFVPMTEELQDMYGKLLEIDNRRNSMSTRINNAYRGESLFYGEGGQIAADYLRKMGYKGFTKTSAQGHKLYAFFSKQKKKIEPKNKPRTWLKPREFWVYTTDSKDNKTKTIHYENYDGTHTAVSGTTQPDTT